MPKLNRLMTHIRWKQMSDMVLEGKHICTVANHFNVHPDTVVRACRFMEVKLPRQINHFANHSRNSQFIILAELLKTDITIEEIISELDTTLWRVRQVLKAARDCGIPGLEHRFSRVS